MPGCSANMFQQGGNSTLASLATNIGLRGGSAGSMRVGTNSDSFMGGKRHKSRRIRRSKKAKKSKKSKKSKKAKKTRKSRKSRR
uniref:Uncharacterized protein n=1 Tax=viral metagenome TaxID=1070528 RepID=A0A6C0EGC8_9ZZZZ